MSIKPAWCSVITMTGANKQSCPEGTRPKCPNSHKHTDGMQLCVYRWSQMFLFFYPLYCCNSYFDLWFIFIIIFPGVNNPSAAKISTPEGGEYIEEEESRTFGSWWECILAYTICFMDLHPIFSKDEHRLRLLFSVPPNC